MKVSKYPDRTGKEIAISHIRRGNVSDIARRVGIVVNDDGTIFDRVTKQRFETLMEWTRAVS